MKFPYDTLSFKHKLSQWSQWSESECSAICGEGRQEDRRCLSCLGLDNPLQNQTEMIAGRYLHELETLLDVPEISSQFQEKIFNEEIVDTFHKLSLIQNLANETTNLIANFGHLLISKLAEHPGPGGKPTEGEGFPKSLYYVLKMFSRVPHVSMEVITNLKEFGMKLIY